MSCDNNRSKFFAGQAKAPAIVKAFGGEKNAAQALEELFNVGRNRVSADPAQIIQAEARTRLLFAQMQAAGLKPPTHSKSGLPRRDALFGYQLVHQTLEAIRIGSDLPDVARQIQEKHNPGSIKTQGFRKYKDGSDVKHWEVAEEEYTLGRRRGQLSVLRGNVAAYKQQLALLPPGQTKRHRELEEAIRSTQSQIDLWDANLSIDGIHPSLRQRYHLAYIKTVKEAIKSGKQVPQAVIEQYDEFREAQSSRQRYNKARHTSFANISAAVDDTMQAGRGYKVKRQDGKPITRAQIDEIAAGMTEIESVLGDLKDILAAINLTIAHTSGKHPFLSTAVGLYSVKERTVSTGTLSPLTRKRIPSLAHELAHCIDFEAGAALGAEVPYHLRTGRQAVSISSLAECDDYRNEGGRALLMDADASMKDTVTVYRLSRRGGAKTPEDEEMAEIVKWCLGPYFRRSIELWARLVEQYISTRLRAQGITDPLSVRGDYTKIPGYWGAEDWARLEPQVEKEIEQRLNLLRGGAATLAHRAHIGLPMEYTVDGRRATVYRVHKGYAKGAPSLEAVREATGGGYSLMSSRFDPDAGKTVYTLLEAGIPYAKIEERAQAWFDRSVLDEDGRRWIYR